MKRSREQAQRVPSGGGGVSGRSSAARTSSTGTFAPPARAAKWRYRRRISPSVMLAWTLRLTRDRASKNSEPLRSVAPFAAARIIRRSSSLLTVPRSRIRFRSPPRRLYTGVATAIER